MGGLPRREAVAVRAARRRVGATDAEPRREPGRRPASSTPTTRRPGAFIGVAQEAGARVLTYGTDPAADVRATRVEEDQRRLRIAYEAPSGAATVDLRLVGRFNVHNALAVVALGEAVGLDPAAVREGLASVAGRARADGAGRRSASRSASSSTSPTARPRSRPCSTCSRRWPPRGGGGLIAVFGSAGERDTAKRPLMGRIAGERARIVVVTDEDPRGEDREAILDDDRARRRGGRQASRPRPPGHRRPARGDRGGLRACAARRHRPPRRQGPRTARSSARTVRGRGTSVRRPRPPCTGPGSAEALSLRLDGNAPLPSRHRQDARPRRRRAKTKRRDRRPDRDAASAGRAPVAEPPHRQGAGPGSRGAARDPLRRDPRGAPGRRPRTGRARRSTSPSPPTRARRGRPASRTSPTRSPRPRSSPSSGIDPIAIQAALLHDVPEDTEYSLTDVEERFGAEVAQLVDGVTKLSKFSTHSHEQQQAENIRKMLLAMAQDIRVVLIKLADRLHNMRTLYGLPSEKQQRIARQTMEIYAPLAERLGIWQMKWELEDLAFKALEPERFRELAKLLDTRRKGRETLHRSRHRRADAAARGGRHQGRPPGPPEAHLQHLEEDGAQERGVRRDLRRLRHPHPRRRGPRLLRGARHRPLAVAPDPGPVRRLHRRPQEQPLPVAPHRGHRARRQAARDPDPDPRRCTRSSEVGIAAHWRYKEGTKSDREYDAKLAWLRQLLDWQRDVSDATEFVEGIKLDIFQDQVFVFTPEGRHQGPAGGRDAARLRLPDPHRRRPPDDRGQGQQPPRPARLPAQERRHRRDRHDQGRARPVARLDERSSGPATPARRSANGSSARTATRTSSTAASRSSASCAAWRGPRSRPSGRTRSPRSRSTTTTTRSTTSTPPSATARSAPRPSSCASASSTTCRARSRPSRRRRSSTRTGGVRVKGVGDLLVRFAKCCHPIPGDPIVGFITRGKGVTVHLQTCPTVDQRARGQPADRGRMGGRADRDLPDRDPGRGLRPDRPAERHHPGRGREQGQHRGRPRRRHAGPHGRRDRDDPGRTRSRSWPGS